MGRTPTHKLTDVVVVVVVAAGAWNAVRTMGRPETLP
jgi:hypothetical protein